jgi:hypothetical protein
MKKTPQKLVLRSETLRTLANMDLARAVGGFDSGDVQCPHQAVVDSGDKACPTGAAVAATTVCP